MYDTLLFAVGHLQAVCTWPEMFHPWAAVFLADYLRGTISPEEFMVWMTYLGEDYPSLGQCILEQKK